jgi:hypothetical protein
VEIVAVVAARVLAPVQVLVRADRADFAGITRLSFQ